MKTRIVEWYNVNRLHIKYFEGYWWIWFAGRAWWIKKFWKDVPIH